MNVSSASLKNIYSNLLCQVEHCLSPSRRLRQILNNDFHLTLRPQHLRKRLLPLLPRLASVDKRNNVFCKLFSHTSLLSHQEIH